MRVLLAVLVAFAALLQVTTAYDAGNYTLEERKELIKLQKDYKNIVAQRSGGLITARCYCDLENEDETACACCLGLNIKSKPEACLKGGLRKMPTMLFLALEVNKRELFSIEIRPEICAKIPVPGFTWIPIRVCLAIYHHDICIAKPVKYSSFKVCLQLDIVILFTIFTLDFNCLWYHDQMFDIDDSIRTPSPGLITYKIGKGVSVSARSFSQIDNGTKIIQVGQLRSAKRLAAIAGAKVANAIKGPSRIPEKVCCRFSDTKEECFSGKEMPGANDKGVDGKPVLYPQEELEKLKKDFCDKKVNEETKNGIL